MTKRKQPLRDGRGTEHQKPGPAAAAPQGTSDSGGTEFKNGRWQVRFRRGGKRERHELFVDGMPAVLAGARSSWSESMGLDAADTSGLQLGIDLRAITPRLPATFQPNQIVRHSSREGG